MVILKEKGKGFVGDLVFFFYLIVFFNFFTISIYYLDNFLMLYLKWVFSSFFINKYCTFIVVGFFGGGGVYVVCCCIVWS